MNSDYDEQQSPLALTPIERQTLILLHQVMRHLDSDEADYHERMVEVLTEGFTMEYENLFTPCSELSKADCGLVFDILDMFRVIKASLAKLDASESAALLAQHEHVLIYQGLDGNDARESRMARYVTFLQSTDRWTELRDDVRAADHGNSHAPMLRWYIAMLGVFQPIWKRKVSSSSGPRSYILDAEELRQLAESRG